MKLSACLMVKDEEKNIGRCLESIRALGCVDEILVLDTGSTDNTVQICKDYGAIVTIPDDLDQYFVETDDGRFLNFGKARTDSYKDAKGEWLLLMDADETINGDATKLIEYLDKMASNTEGISLPFVDIQQELEVMRFLSPRIFRNGKVHFEEIVHNRPMFRPPAIHIKEIDLHIKHFGYDLDPQHEKIKRKRTISLLQHRLKVNPEDYGALFYLSQMYANTGDSDQAIDYAIKYIAHKDDIPTFNPSIYFCLVMEAHKAKNYELMDQWLSEALKVIPNDIDIAAATMTYGEAKQKPLVIKRGAENFIRNFDALAKNPTFNGARFIYNNNEFSLCRALFHSGLMNVHEGIDQLKRLLTVLKNIKDQPKFVKTVSEDLEKELNKMKFYNWRSIIGNLPGKASGKVIAYPKKKKKRRKKKGHRRYGK